MASEAPHQDRRALSALQVSMHSASEWCKMMVNADHDDEMVNEDQSETEAHEASTALARSPAGNAFAAAGKGGKTTQTKIKRRSNGAWEKMLLRQP